FRERGIAVAIVAVTIVSIGIGTLQVAGGASAYFYRITNHGVAVGVFANANHNATLLLVCIPFMAALQQALLEGRRSPHSASAIRLFAGAVFLVILTGLLINGSLAGLGLGVPVALVTGLVFSRTRMRDRRPLVRRGMVVATLLVSVAAIVAIVFGPFGNNLFGEQTSNAALSRQTSFALTYRAALEYFPVGSGIGSFQPIYRMQEPLASVGTTFMNHAHNDWLELLLETGAVGIALTASFLTWWLVRVRMIWRAEVPDPFAQAASIATAVMMLHSLVDYPLRTAALSVAFAACLGLMSGARPHRRKQRVPPSTRHLTL
ncbi:MAG: O-antigen ligase family protein, partial [Sphingomonas sp.]